jgi:hypothetical protein
VPAALASLYTFFIVVHQRKNMREFEMRYKNIKYQLFCPDKYLAIDSRRENKCVYDGGGVERGAIIKSR